MAPGWGSLSIAVAVALSALASALLAAPARADVYRWVDANGVVHFTDSKTDPRFVPYRSEEPKTPTREWKGETAEEGFGGEEPLTIVYTAPDGRTQRIDRSRWDELLRDAAAHYRLPFAFVKAVAKVESNFNPQAVSRAQAKGMMQLIDATAEDMNVRDPFDPRQNVFAAARYLRILANTFDGDLALTAAAYNAGPHRVLKAGRRVPNIAETTAYVKRVLALYEAYRKAR